MITASVVGALVWGLLSVAMVAWGLAGVLLTGIFVTVIGVGVAVDAYRQRHR